MGLTSFIIKQISIEKDKLFEVILGRAYDEYQKKYSEVYCYEIKEFLMHLESDLSTLESNGMSLNKEILKSQIIVKWFCDFDNCDMQKLDTFIESLLETAKRNSIFQGHFEIEEGDKAFLKRLLTNEVERNRKILINLILNEKDDTTKILVHFREGNFKHYENIINNIKKDYIESLNLLFKLFNVQPKDWSTGLSLHESVCSSFNIDRESFLF